MVDGGVLRRGGGNALRSERVSANRSTSLLGHMAYILNLLTLQPKRTLHLRTLLLN